jgi:hypothetical protein
MVGRMSLGEVLVTVVVRVREWLPRLPGRVREGLATFMTEPSAAFRSPAVRITIWLVGLMVLVGVLIKLSPLVLPAKFYGK